MDAISNKYSDFMSLFVLFYLVFSTLSYNETLPDMFLFDNRYSLRKKSIRQTNAKWTGIKKLNLNQQLQLSKNV